jgi:tyrosyl-tRNA synthetase
LLAASGLASSNSEAKRLLNEGAIELIRKSGESQKISAGYVVENLQSGDVLKRGGRQFVRLVEE